MFERPPMSRALYLKLHATDRLRIQLMLSDLLGLASALFTAAAALYAKVPVILIDAALNLLFVLLQRKRGRLAALLWLLYSGSATLLMLLDSGILTGLVPLLAALLCCLGQRQLEKEMWEARDEL